MPCNSFRWSKASLKGWTHPFSNCISIVTDQQGTRARRQCNKLEHVSSNWLNMIIRNLLQAFTRMELVMPRVCALIHGSERAHSIVTYMQGRSQLQYMYWTDVVGKARAEKTREVHPLFKNCSHSGSRPEQVLTD